MNLSSSETSSLFLNLNFQFSSFLEGFYERQKCSRKNSFCWSNCLTLTLPIISINFVRIKINLNFHFCIFLWYLKKIFTVFIDFFRYYKDVEQQIFKIFFSFNYGSGQEGLTYYHFLGIIKRQDWIPSQKNLQISYFSRQF